MRINSKNMFTRIVTKEKRLDSIEKRVSEREQRLLDKESNVTINTNKFFQFGYERGLEDGDTQGNEQGRSEGYREGYTEGYNVGFDEGFQKKIAKQLNKKKPEKPEKREYGGPVTKGKPYLVGEAGVEQFMPKGPIPDLPGLGGGGGGTNAITSKAKTKTMGNYMKDLLKISTIPARFLLNIESPEDPLSKFASPKTPEDKVSSAISNYVQAESNNNEFGSITSSMVNKPRVQTVVQPVIQTNTKQVPTPMPMGSSTQVIKTSKSKLPPSIAKMIN